MTAHDKRAVYLDVAPLFEESWTGIPVVTAQLAKFALFDKERPWFFLFNNQIIPPGLVEYLLFRRSGRWVKSNLIHILLHAKIPTFENASEAIAIFPNVKPMHGNFFREATIVHDLSTLLTPQFHHNDTIVHHANRFRKDIETTDAFFCVSRATADDLSYYFKVDPSKLIVTNLGVEWALRPRLAASKFLQNVSLPPFVVVIGTIEPRKNIKIIFDYLLSHPTVLQELSFVFVGRDGWLDERRRLEERLDKLGISREKILFTGFVDEALKLALLHRAEFSIFPSFFEGFGLPVLESTSVGCPVLCSLSSSLTEAGNTSCEFFDPTDPRAFAAAFDRMRARIASESVRTKRDDPEVLFVPSDLSWDRFMRPIISWIREQDNGKQTNAFW